VFQGSLTIKQKTQASRVKAVTTINKMNTQLPPTHRALVQRVYADPLQVETIPTPQPTPGSAIIRILAAPVVSYTSEIYDGTRKYPYQTPLVTGISGIGRIAAVGPDATSLAPGQLVYVDCVIHGRDDPSAIILSGLTDGGSEGSRKLMRGEWRDSTYAEYAKAPLENCVPLDEKRLTASPTEAGLGYDIPRLAYFTQLLVPYGGLRDINLQAGETVIIAPATGGFGGAAVLVALAMGARVIAMGRNLESLEKLKKLSDRVETVPITGDLEGEVAALARFGPADAYLDISPAQAANSTHVKAGIMSLRHRGRVSLMGGFIGDVAIPHRIVLRNDIKLNVSVKILVS
jgi:D-arabinose 1-dehydrogenase-like Zn-dependent alcohol dehydrogenase